MPHRGKPNEPAFVRHTAQFAAAEVFGVVRLPADWGSLTYSASWNWLGGETKEGIYAGQGLEGSPDDSFTASLICGSTALTAIAEEMSGLAGDFVCAAAGDLFEASMAAWGSAA